MAAILQTSKQQTVVPRRVTIASSSPDMHDVKSTIAAAHFCQKLAEEISNKENELRELIKRVEQEQKALASYKPAVEVIEHDWYKCSHLPCKLMVDQLNKQFAEMRKLFDMTSTTSVFTERKFYKFTMAQLMKDDAECGTGVANDTNQRRLLCIGSGLLTNQEYKSREVFLLLFDDILVFLKRKFRSRRYTFCRIVPQKEGAILELPHRAVITARSLAYRAVERRRTLHIFTPNCLNPVFVTIDFASEGDVMMWTQSLDVAVRKAPPFECASRHGNSSIPTNNARRRNLRYSSS